MGRTARVWAVAEVGVQGGEAAFCVARCSDCLIIVAAEGEEIVRKRRCKCWLGDEIILQWMLRSTGTR
jgi:hypothetical protein